jgi:hypothetical protein
MTAQSAGRILFPLILVVSAACSETPERPAGISPEPTAGPTGTSSPSPAEGCVTEDPTSLSATWTTLPSSSGSYSFAYPADWEDVSGDIGATADDLLAPETLEELGLTSESIPGDFVQDPASGDNVGAWSFGQAESSIETIAQRQVELFGSTSGISVTDPGAEGCLSGERALGLELQGTVAGEGTRYQKLLYVLRDGGLYLLYIDAADAASEEVFDEVVRTWEWLDDVAET